MQILKMSRQPLSRNSKRLIKSWYSNLGTHVAGIPPEFPKTVQAYTFPKLKGVRVSFFFLSLSLSLSLFFFRGMEEKRQVLPPPESRHSPLSGTDASPTARCPSSVWCPLFFSPRDLNYGVLLVFPMKPNIVCSSGCCHAIQGNGTQKKRNLSDWKSRFSSLGSPLGAYLPTVTLYKARNVAGSFCWERPLFSSWTRIFK